jgi:peptidyl-dipeptidase Dcp
MALALTSGAAFAADDGIPPPRENPFAKPSTLFLQAPPFNEIRDTDYEPAIDEGMKQQLAEWDAIAGDKAAATFDNTIAALEKSGRMLERANNAFNGVVQANTNDVLNQTQTDIAPKLAAHQDAMYLNAKLFQRVKSLYDRRTSLKLDPEQMQVLTIYYKQFVHAGALLNEADKTKLREMNKQISTLETAFQQKLIAAAKAGALTIGNKDQLAGLSDAEIAAAAKDAKDRNQDGKWVIPLQNTTQQPLLNSLSDRATRQALFDNGWTRAEKKDANDTRETISTLAQLRAQKAKLLGYPNYAAYVLYDQMAKTPEAVEKFLGQLVRQKAKEENAELQKTIDASGAKFKLAPYDWEYYAEKVRKAQYDLDQNQLKPYFLLDNVLEKGVFYAANMLYGITFKERKDIPVYQPDVRVFEVTDYDGSPLGLMYFDYFKRDNKAGGAWMSNFVNQSKLLGTSPVIYNVANFQKPAPGQPALLTFDDVTTMFHEFGHALHGLFASQTYPMVSGTNVARDYVEFPSQFNEHWALHPDVMRHYALHYITEDPLPPELVEKLKKSQTFNQGYNFGEILAASELDMQWHKLTAEAPKQDVDAFEEKALKAAGVDFPNVPPRYRSSYFLHIWANGYASGYYAYTWTEMLADSAYRWFEENGGMTRSNGQRFRNLILSKGHTMDYGPMFKAFLGKDPDIEPLLEQRGLVAKKP